MRVCNYECTCTVCVCVCRVRAANVLPASEGGDPDRRDLLPAGDGAAARVVRGAGQVRRPRPGHARARLPRQRPPPALAVRCSQVLHSTVYLVSSCLFSSLLFSSLVRPRAFTSTFTNSPRPSRSLYLRSACCPLRVHVVIPSNPELQLLLIVLLS